MEMRAAKKALEDKAAKAEADLARKTKAEMKAEAKVCMHVAYVHEMCMCIRPRCACYATCVCAI